MQIAETRKVQKSELSGYMNTMSNESHPCGLINHGNTCYMNAALQSLGSVAPLRDYLAKVNLNDKGEVVKEVSIMMQRMSTSSGPFSPHKIKNEIAESNARFGQTSQEDSQEFLQALVEKLHQCLKTNVTDAPIMDLEKHSTELEASNAAWYNYLINRGKSIVTDLFEGQWQSSMTCGECDEVTLKFDPLMFLPVPIPREKCSDHSYLLQECMKDAFKSEYFGGCEWYCSKCDQKADMERKPSISKLPNILLVYLKRFQTNFQSGERSKVNSQVTFPLKDFELSDLMSESAKSVRLTYTLIAVINHFGNMTGGHYTAYGKRNNQWFSFNDNTVEPISEDRIVSRYAYVLLYQQDTANGREHQKSNEIQPKDDHISSCSDHAARFSVKNNTGQPQEIEMETFEEGSGKEERGGEREFGRQNRTTGMIVNHAKKHDRGNSRRRILCLCCFKQSGEQESITEEYNDRKHEKRYNETSV